MINYDRLTVKELKEKCKKRGISGYSTLTKIQLIDLLSDKTKKTSALNYYTKYGKKICKSKKIEKTCSCR